jgi:DNA-binding MarR family transcriptional regulator
VLAVEAMGASCTYRRYVYSTHILADGDLPGALAALTGFLNRPQADAVLLRRAGSSLDRALFPLLVRAGMEEGIQVSELAERVGRHYTTVSRQVTALERQGLVRREADPADKRVSVVRLTDQGRAETARISAARSEVLSVIFADWTDQETAELTRLVTKLVAGMHAAVSGAADNGLEG